MSSTRSDSHQNLRYAAVSDVGMRRPKNQDTYASVMAIDEDWHRHGHLFIVADGMGAHAAGELASQQAVEEVVRHYHDSTEPTPPEALKEAIRIANAEIHRRGSEDTKLYNMGTTCSALTLLTEGALVAHVGDSRVYRYRNQRIQQLTFDHSLVWEMRAAGQIDKGDEGWGVPRNVITRCLGPQADVKVDLEGPYSVRVGDVFLLCSDGLTGRVSDAEIGAIIGLLEPETSAQLLVDMANLRGGSDNITAVVVQVTGDVISSRHQKELTWKMSEPQTPPPAASAGWWLALGLAILSALLLLSLQQQLGAMLAGLAAAGAAVRLGFQRLRARRPSPPLLGKGPYENVACRVDTAFTASISETMEMMLDRLALPANECAEIQAELAQVKGASVEEASICQRCADLAKRLMCAVREEMQSTSSDSSVELF